MDQLNNLGPVQAVSQFWQSLTGPQKLITTIFAAASVVLLAVVSVVATRPNMDVLFSGLEPEDAGAIVAKLQERKIEYEIDGGGSVIKVPAKNVHEMRLQMASNGLPEGGSVGFEIFDKTNLGMTEFSQRVSYQRALQGELTRTINQIDRVQQARIHIVIPEKDLFDSTEKHPTASVVVKLRPGGSLADDQVAGIVHLVSAAVEGMKPNYVNVVDTRGNVLSEASDDGSAFNSRMSSSQLEVKRTYDREMQNNIGSMLERVLGPNKAIVRVNTKMNFDQKETSSETYEPVKAGAAQRGTTTETGQPVEGYKGVLLSEQRTEETYGNGSQQPGGATVGGVVGRVGGPAGVQPNVRPNATTSVTELNGGGYQRQETSAKYEVSKTTEHIIQTPGTVERISVAVMLDGKVDPGRIPAIQRVVEASAGIDQKRGDKVIVESVPFDDTVAKTEEKELAAVASKESYLSIGKTVGGILLLAGFLFFIKGMLKGIKIGMPQAASETGGLAAAAAPMTYSIPAGAPIPVGVGAASGAPGQNPQEVAQVVREWISN